MKKPRVLLADDHALVIEGLQSLLASYVDLIGASTGGRKLLEAARCLRPEIILLHVSMPDLNGIGASRQLRKDLPDAKLFLITQHADAIYVEEALRIGVSGYVLKQGAASELIRAIQKVQRGQRYLSPLLARAEIQDRALRDEPAGSVLTARLREVLQFVAEVQPKKLLANCESLRELPDSTKHVLCANWGALQCGSGEIRCPAQNDHRISQRRRPELPARRYTIPNRRREGLDDSLRRTAAPAAHRCMVRRLESQVLCPLSGRPRRGMGVLEARCARRRTVRLLPRLPGIPPGAARSAPGLG